MSSKKRVLALALSMSMIFGSVGDFATLAVSAEEAVPEVQTEAVQAEAAAPQPAAESTAPAPAAEAPRRRADRSRSAADRRSGAGRS